MIGWHRLFGLALTDFFAGSPFTVDLEKDLSLKQQMLDVVVLRRQPGVFTGGLPDGFTGRLPDGFEDLADHNLLTYKSLREPLDDWAIDELIGHYVNYRKQVPPPGQLLAQDRFRLYGASTRYPEKLAGQVSLMPEQSGVYRVIWGTHHIRILVLSEMPDSDRNALWNLFSGVREKVASAATHYQGHMRGVSTIMNQLFECYALEGVAMSYTMDDFLRDASKEILEKLPPEEILRGIPVEERLRGLPPEERLRGLPPEERLRGLPPEERLRGLPPEERLRGLPPEERLRGLSPEEILRGLSVEEIQAYLEKMKRQRRAGDKH